ncbi:hypothetical protein Ctha_1215 [Chloroherpeton thalassium ATCC 35110]|uniref:Uncharacterized protein n=2 Tax=Chloroherpeton thalassium TaxID=100716 RepID=B3QYY6_CHLT3|nr:hypothetical protein Ctha_1215 [Chloroherpeton thalassium ATCC 35110]
MKLYIVAILSIFGGMLITTGIAKINGVSAGAIYGYGQENPIRENEKLLAEINELKAKLEKDQLEMDTTLASLRAIIIDQEKKISKSKEFLNNISNNLAEGIKSENLQRAVAKELRKIADFLDNNYGLE